MCGNDFCLFIVDVTNTVRAIVRGYIIDVHGSCNGAADRYGRDVGMPAHLGA